MHMQIRICKLHEEKLIFSQQRNLFPVGLYRNRDKKGILILKNESWKSKKKIHC